ncbi:MAG: hypothetical protein V4438_00600 [Patescibacteria group bacterium]
MKDKTPNKRRQPPSNAEIYEAVREAFPEQDHEDGGVMELGSTAKGDGIMFEHMRTRITPGEVLKRGFDEAVRRRCNIYGRDREDKLPPAVDAATFDNDVVKINLLDGKALRRFDDEVMYARMERRDPESNGIFVSPHRASGFGHDVFGIAYDIVSGKWCATNEFGLHSQCEQHLRLSIELAHDGPDDAEVSIVSGFIFQLSSIRTPIMTPHGYFFRTPALMKKAFEDMWSWKRFIPITDIEISHRVYLYKQLFTPEYAEMICQQEPK